MSEQERKRQFARRWRDETIAALGGRAEMPLDEISLQDCPNDLYATALIVHERKLARLAREADRHLPPFSDDALRIMGLLPAQSTGSEVS